MDAPRTIKAMAHDTTGERSSVGASRCARSTRVGSLGKGVYLALLIAGIAIPHQVVAQAVALTESASSIAPEAESTHAIAPVPPVRRADFERESASRDAAHIADWVVESSDNDRRPFMIVDKIAAKVFVFEADGKLRGAAPALLGLARGDDSVPGIGERALSDIRPEERTTPAGRFVAALDLNLKGEEILWVDYDAAISLHRVVTGKASDRRLQRLASATPLDNRISYGCINVPVKFYQDVISPAFRAVGGVVYVLPEIRSMQQVFRDMR